MEEIQEVINLIEKIKIYLYSIENTDMSMEIQEQANELYRKIYKFIARKGKKISSVIIAIALLKILGDIEIFLNESEFWREMLGSKKSDDVAYR